MVKKILFFILVLVASFTACKKPEAFTYKGVRNFNVQSFGIDTSVVSMQLDYYNPNQFGVKLKKISCDIFIENNYAGHFNLDTSIAVTSNSNFTIPATMKVGMKNVYKNALTYLFSKELAIKAVGKTTINKMGINLTFPINYEGKHKF